LKSALECPGPLPDAADVLILGAGAAGLWAAGTAAARGKSVLLLEKNPRVAASKLAAKVGRETASFKIDVRKLKRLGLTQSFEVGYELSPRGRAFLRAARKRR